MAVPEAKALSDVAQKPLMFECATEFYNFIQLALDGVKFCRLDLSQGPQIEFPLATVEGYNRRVLYIKQRVPVSAFEVA